MEVYTSTAEHGNAVHRKGVEGPLRFLSRAEAFTIPDLIRTKVNLLPEGIDQVRVCEIVGLDLQADGGTHVVRTGAVGPIRVVGHESKGRINKRLCLTIER